MIFYRQSYYNLDFIPLWLYPDVDDYANMITFGSYDNSSVILYKDPAQILESSRNLDFCLTFFTETICSGTAFLGEFFQDLVR